MCKISTFTAKMFLKQHFPRETVSKAKILKQNFFFSETTEVKCFFSEMKQNLRSKTEVKRSETVSVLLRFALK